MVVVSLVLICASVAMVYSASSHTVKGTLNVSYQAINVGATVSAQYQKAGGSATSMTTTGSQGGPASITFAISESEPINRSLSWSDPISLDDDHPYVLFTYSFHNDATSGADPFYVSFDQSNTSIMSGSSFSVYYYNGDSTFNANTLASKYTTITTANKTSPTSIGTSGKVQVSATGTAYIYVLVVASVVSENANLNGNSSSSVSFIINHYST